MFDKHAGRLWVFGVFVEFAAGREELSAFIKLLGPDGEHLYHSDVARIPPSLTNMQVAFTVPTVLDATGPYEVLLFVDNNLISTRRITVV